MFKKTLAAVAVLGAFAGSAYAADVTLYGRADLGVRYTAFDTDMAGQDDLTKFEMASGNYTGSRFGLKGSEDLGNGVKVGFVLENGFAADSGSLSTDGKIFDREALLYVAGDFGKVGFGRVGILNGTAGSFGIGQFSSMETGWGDVGSQNLIWGAGFGSRYDNMVSYVTPDFAGFKVHAQYSFGANTDGTKVEGKSSTDRYYGVGASYNNGPVAARLIVDSVNKASYPTNHGVDDTVRVTFGGSYDFGAVKPFLAASYFKDGSVGLPGLAKDNDFEYPGTYDGYGVVVGAAAPVLGGTFKATLGYLNAEEQNVGQGDLANDMTRWIVGAGYEYKLSKRTLVYVDAGYGQDDIDNASDGDKPSYYQAAAGLVHYF